MARDRAHVDRPEAGTVTGSHVLVESSDGFRPGELTELLVHVVCAGTRVVTEPDTEVLDFQWLCLMNLQREEKPCEKQWNTPQNSS